MTELWQKYPLYFGSFTFGSSLLTVSFGWLVFTIKTNKARFVAPCDFVLTWLQPLWQHFLDWWQWRGWFVVINKSQGALLVSELIIELLRWVRGLFLSSSHACTTISMRPTSSDTHRKRNFLDPVAWKIAACCRRGACVHSTSRCTQTQVC